MKILGHRWQPRHCGFQFATSNPITFSRDELLHLRPLTSDIFSNPLFGPRKFFRTFFRRSSSSLWDMEETQKFTSGQSDHQNWCPPGMCHVSTTLLPVHKWLYLLRLLCEAPEVCRQQHCYQSHLEWWRVCIWSKSGSAGTLVQSEQPGAEHAVDCGDAITCPCCVLTL